uniref:hypothetical protein n=1 Tax=Gluconobacter kondonii TaxID=941463 RepID=UPI002013BE81|nr:hypothetical protein [Gluconobacter kondonii]
MLHGQRIDEVGLGEDHGLLDAVAAGGKFQQFGVLPLYCRSHGVRGRGAPMTYLAHKASFHSRENNTPSKHGIKHLGTSAPSWAHWKKWA